jgi:hypothetical protein
MTAGLRWLTLASVAVLAAGLAVLLIYCLLEALGTPGGSFVDAYWRGRLPWMGFAEGLIVSGATASAVSGAASVAWSGGWLRRLLILPPGSLVALWWLFALVMSAMRAVPCPTGEPCPAPSPDPWAYAYSLPETSVLFLILPALFIVGLALRSGRRAAAEPAT